MINFGYGQSFRPFGNSPWSVRLPDNATVDPGSAVASAELVHQAALATPTVNTRKWTLEPVVVPAAQPLVPVGWTRTDGQFNQLKAVCALGIPIPEGWLPTNDADSSGSFWQPDYVHPVTGQRGRLFELYGVKVTTNADGTLSYKCYLGTRLYGVNDTTGARQYSAQSYTDYATNPDSLYADPKWGVQGSGIPYSPGVLTKADCDRGYADHALLFDVVNARAGGFVWPALKDDGNDHNTAQPLREGQRWRFPPGYQLPTGLHPMAQLIGQALTDHGCFVTDRGSCLAFRAAPSCVPYLGTAAEWQVLAGFPWADLQLLVPGSDANHVPTS